MKSENVTKTIYVNRIPAATVQSILGHSFDFLVFRLDYFGDKLLINIRAVDSRK